MGLRFKKKVLIGALAALTVSLAGGSAFAATQGPSLRAGYHSSSQLWLGGKSNSRMVGIEVSTGSCVTKNFQATVNGRYFLAANVAESCGSPSVVSVYSGGHMMKKTIARDGNTMGSGTGTTVSTVKTTPTSIISTPTTKAGGTTVTTVKSTSTTVKATTPTTVKSPSTTPTTVKSTGSTGSAQAASYDFPFNGGPFKTPIPANPKLDANNAAMVNTMLNVKPTTSNNGTGIFNIADDSFGIPIYKADASTPKYNLSCIKGVPIPAGAVANTGGDHKMEVIDTSTNFIWDLWEYKNDHASCQFAGVSSVNGKGDGFTAAVGNSTGTTATHVSSVAGIIRAADIKSGSINHALVYLSSFSDKQIRYPAQFSDGPYTGAGGIPEGARFQLDPSVNVDAIAGITPAEKMVAHALQTYGAYDIDTGANSAIFYAEKGQGADANTLTGAFGPDWSRLNHIPWDKIRFLDASVTTAANTN